MPKHGAKYISAYAFTTVIMIIGIIATVATRMPDKNTIDPNISIVNTLTEAENTSQPSSESPLCASIEGFTGHPICIGYYVNKMSTYKNSENSFYSDFYFWLRWRGDVYQSVNVPLENDLLFDAAPTNERSISFEFMNSISKPEIVDQTAREQHCNVIVDNIALPCSKVKNENLEKWYYRVYRVRGDFIFSLNLQEYPFDDQRLEIELELSELLAKHAYFVADTSSRIPERLNVTGWAKGTPEIRIENIQYNTNFGIPSQLQSSYSEYARSTFSLNVERNPLPYVLKTLVPLFIIVFMGSLSFFLQPSNDGTRLSLTTGALLAALALHITVSSALPDVGYLTIMDKCFINGYLHIFAATAETIIVASLYAQRKNLAQRIDRISYILFPLTFLIGFLISTSA